jgi:hypothetical protein
MATKGLADVALRSPLTAARWDGCAPRCAERPRQQGRARRELTAQVIGLVEGRRPGWLGRCVGRSGLVRWSRRVGFERHRCRRRRLRTAGPRLLGRRLGDGPRRHRDGGCLHGLDWCEERLVTAPPVVEPPSDGEHHGIGVAPAQASGREAFLGAMVREPDHALRRVEPVRDGRRLGATWALTETGHAAEATALGAITCGSGGQNGGSDSRLSSTRPLGRASESRALAAACGTWRASKIDSKTSAPINPPHGTTPVAWSVSRRHRVRLVPARPQPRAPWQGGAWCFA